MFDALITDLKRSTKLFMDETRAPVLDPGSRRTKTGYFWALARDDRPWGGDAPPGVAFTYAPGRGGLHAERILQGFSGTLQVDGYAGYNELIAPDRVGSDIRLAYCWAHARRKLVEITRNGAAPIAEEGVKRISELYRHRGRTAWPSSRHSPSGATGTIWAVGRRHADLARPSPGPRRDEVSLGEALAYIARYCRMV